MMMMMIIAAGSILNQMISIHLFVPATMNMNYLMKQLVELLRSGDAGYGVEGGALQVRLKVVEEKFYHIWNKIEVIVSINSIHLRVPDK